MKPEQTSSDHYTPPPTSNIRQQSTPLILGSVFHFLFVSIRPFKDGNGRAARLMHSFILLKSGHPIFAFDPDRKYEYFNYLEMGRESDISDFVRFIVEEHKSILSSLHN